MVTTYSAGDTGGLTQLASLDEGSGDVSDLALSPDGSKAVVALSDASLSEYSTTTLDLLANYQGLGALFAATMSPDGTHIAAGYYGDAGYTTVGLFAGTDTAPLWDRSAATSPLTWERYGYQVAPGAITFSSDGTQVYAVVGSEPGQPQDQRWLFASGISPASTSLRLSTSGGAPTYVVSASAQLSKPAVGKVWFYTSNIQDAVTHTFEASANSDGRATVRFHMPFNGYVAAAFEGGLNRFPAGSEIRFTVAATPRLTLGGKYTIKDGMKQFNDPKQVLVHGRLSPWLPGRYAAFTLQARRHGHWKVVESRRVQVGSNGTTIHLPAKSPTAVPLRFEMAFAGDSFNTASQVFSPTFELN
jgi:hypothetical protein